MASRKTKPVAVQERDSYEALERQLTPREMVLATPGNTGGEREAAPRDRDVRPQGSDWDEMLRTGDFGERRLDIEWLALQAIREAAQIALRGQFQVGYAQALAIGGDVAPALFHPEVSLIARAHEQPGVREYRQLAEAESQIQGRQVTALEVIEREIAIHEKLANTKGERDKIVAKLHRLHSIREQLTRHPYTENQLLVRDVFQATRLKLPEPFRHGDKYVEYRLPYGRGLRIRMLHPDRAEQVTGADLIYELYSPRNREARVAFVQYKIWDGKSLPLGRPLGKSRVQRQLSLLNERVCETDFCEGPIAKGDYRMPYCAAFLRPTDKLQAPDARLMSSGLHIPLCVFDHAKSHTKRGGETLFKHNVLGRAVSPAVFEELFNHEMLGTRSLTFDDLEQFYKKYEVMRPTDGLILHAQGVWIDD